MNTLANLALLNGMSFDQAPSVLPQMDPTSVGTAIPEHMCGRSRSINVKNSIPMIGEFDGSIEGNIMTWYDTKGNVSQKLHVEYEDGHVVIVNGLSRTPIGYEAFDDVKLTNVDVFATWMQLAAQSMVPMPKTFSEAMKDPLVEVSIGFKCKPNTSCNFDDIKASTEDTFYAGVENVDGPLPKELLSENSFIQRQIILDHHHQKIQEIDTKSYTDGRFYSKVDGKIAGGKGHITGMNDQGEFLNVNEFDGGFTMYGVLKAYVEGSNIFSFMEFGQSDDRSIDTLQKAYDSPKAVAGVSIVCMSALCYENFEHADPLPATIASLLA